MSRFVVLTRDSHNKPWELSYIVEREELAWRTAEEIQQQEQLLGNKTKVIVCTETDYDRGKYQPLRSPKSKVEYLSAPCPHCGKEMPTNGAAQFSHLRKHLQEAIAKGQIDKNANPKTIKDLKEILSKEHKNES